MISVAILCNRIRRRGCNLRAKTSPSHSTVLTKYNVIRQRDLYSAMMSENAFNNYEFVGFFWHVLRSCCVSVAQEHQDVLIVDAREISFRCKLHQLVAGSIQTIGLTRKGSF